MARISCQVPTDLPANPGLARAGGRADGRLPRTSREARRPADEVFTRYARNWKPGTLKINRNYYRNHILPRFKGCPIAGIDSRDVRQWFASLHAKPAAADRSAPILSVIMRQAEIYGYRPEGSNPCKGIKRYRCEGRERFLSAAEIRSLAAVLDRFEASAWDVRDVPVGRVGQSVGLAETQAEKPILDNGL